MAENFVYSKDYLAVSDSWKYIPGHSFLLQEKGKYEGGVLTLSNDWHSLHHW